MQAFAHGALDYLLKPVRTARLLTALDLKIGDSIDVGMKTLKLTRVLTYEPDRAGNFYSLTPRVLINLDDLAATGVVQPGSRVSYRELWRGEPQALETYRQLIKPGLAANQRIQDARDGNRQIGGALGLAVLSTIATTRTNDVMATGHSTLANGLTEGFQSAFFAGAVIWAPQAGHAERGTTRL